uniref:rRNA-processing protein UTP23 homolog n=1 Tax=Lygus hesperus TaxID=30085 RepID=A0A0K8T081_LYGHE
MRINRQKKVNRYLCFYANNFGFRKPYQILIDGTFCHTALKDKINLSDQMPNYLDGDVKLLTTPCAIIETEKLGPPVYGAMLILKQFAVHKCGHTEPISAAACFRHMLGKKNKSRYMIATQDRELQSRVRMVRGTPLLFIHRKAPTLEPPSPLSVHAANTKQQQSVFLSDGERQNLKKAKEAILGPQQPLILKRKNKKVGGPNPLSCKKKRTEIKQKKKVKNKKKNPQSSGDNANAPSGTTAN